MFTNVQRIEDIDFVGLLAWLGSIQAREQRDGLNVQRRLADFGFPASTIPAWYGRGEPSGMVISSDLVRILGAPEPGSYGGWGFQHSANIRAIAKLGHEAWLREGRANDLGHTEA